MEENEIIQRLQVLSNRLDTAAGMQLYIRTYEDNLENISANTKKTKVFKTLKTTYNDTVKGYSDLMDRINNAIVNMPYLEQVRIAYFKKESKELEAIVKDYRHVLRKILNPSGDYTFLDFDGTKVVRVVHDKNGGYKKAMGWRDAYDLGEHFMSGRLEVGQKYGDHEILKIYDNSIQIACSRYTKKMIQALWDPVSEKKNGSNS